MKNLLKYAVVGAALVLCSAAQSRASITLTFEGLKDSEPIDNFYNGGYGGGVNGGPGSGPGPNYGVSFTSDSLAIISQLTSNGSGNFANNPSGVTVAFFLIGAGDMMNIAGGFNTGFSFYYSAAEAGSVTVWSGLNGTGNLLATVSLTAQYNNPSAPYPEGPNGPTFNNWTPIGVSFSGTAESAIFSGAANYIAFDNITLGSSTPYATPEPSTFVIAGLGCLGFVGYALRRRRTGVA